MHGGDLRGRVVRSVGALALLGGVLSAGSGPAAAETVVTVTSTADTHDPGTLRAAIDTANTDGGATTVQLPAGTYTLDLCGMGFDDDNATGDLDHVLAEPLTVLGLDTGATIAQTCAGERVLDQHGSALLTLSGITVTGGSHTAPPGLGASGGGVRAEGDVTVTGTTITGNTAAGGTGVAADPPGPGGSAIGGGLWADGAVTITSSTITGNTATGGTGADGDLVPGPGLGGHATGGGIASSGSVTVTNSTIAGNTAAGGAGGVVAEYSSTAQGGAARGGGIHADGLLTITDSTFTDNAAIGGASWGGATGGAAHGAGIEVTGSTFSANTASGGPNQSICGLSGASASGGALSADGDLALVAATLLDNEATGGGGGGGLSFCPAGSGGPARGGAIRAGGNVSVAGSTLSGNTAQAGPGYDFALQAFATGSPGGWAQGGGIDGGPTTITDSTISGNAVLGGPAVHGDGGGAGGGGVRTLGALTVTGSTLSGNTAHGGPATGTGFTPDPPVGGYGRGGAVDTSSADVSNSTFDANEALGGEPGGDGAGDHLFGANAALTMATVTGSAGRSLAVPDLTLTGTVVTVLPGGTACDAAVTSSSYNQVADTSCGLAGTGDVEDAPDPLLGPLTDNGGPTPTRMPPADSPLVDVIPAGECPLGVDQRGVARPPAAACDVGSVEAPAASTYIPVDPVRILDSRLAGASPWDGSPLGPGEDRALTVAGTHGVPVGATAVVVSITVTQPSAASYLVAHPSDTAPPTAANLLYAPNQTVTNQATVTLGPDGALDVFNQLGTTHVVIDLVGYYTPAPTGDLHTALTPTRALDSRTTTGGWSTSPLGAGQSRTVPTTGLVPPGTTAVVVNLTATNPTTNTWIGATPAGTATTANLLVAAGETRSALLTVALAPDGTFTLTNNTGTTHLIADIVAAFHPTQGDRYHPLTPTRILDTRTDNGLTGPTGPNSLRTLDPTHTGAIPPQATAITGTLTATDGTAPTYLTLTPTPGQAPAPTATLLAGPNQTIPNATTTAIGPGPGTDLYNQQGTIHTTLDIAGWYQP